MKEQSDFDPQQAAKRLLREARSGALATLLPGSGGPYCSLVNVATAADGTPLLLISKLAVHTKNILVDHRVSLMLDERKQGDPLEGARVMLMGKAVVTDDPIIRRRYLLRHPEAEMFAGFRDFAFYKVELTGVHLVAGFGRIVDLEPGEVLTDLSDAAALVRSGAGYRGAYEPGSCRYLPALCDEAVGRGGGGLALRRLRSGRDGIAARPDGAAAVFSAAHHFSWGAPPKPERYGGKGAGRGLTEGLLSGGRPTRFHTCLGFAEYPWQAIGY